jgi:hypothetical protein
MPSDPSSSLSAWTSAASRTAAESAADSDQDLLPGGAGEERRRDEALVWAILDDLSPADRELLRLAFGQGFEAPEIAVTLGTSVRRAQSQMRAATDRFESRSRALILTSRARIDCGALLTIVRDVGAGEPQLSERQCKSVAEHSASCPTCTEILADWSVGAELLNVLAAEIQITAPSRELLEPDRGRRLAFGLTRPMAFAGSAAATLAIVGTAVGLTTLTGHTTSGAPKPVATRTSHIATPSSTPSPTPTPTPTPSRSPSAVAPLAPAPKKTTSPSPSHSASPSPTTTPPPSPTTTPPPSPTTTPPPSPTTTPPPSPTTTPPPSPTTTTTS